MTKLQVGSGFKPAPMTIMLKFRMLILPFTERDADVIFTKSLEILKSGGMIAYPTESFYALGVLAMDENAINRLFALKGRSADKPLPLIIGDMDTLASIVKHVPAQAEKLIERFWPGPLTLIFEAKDNIPALLTGGRGKVAVRIPGESVALHLARMLRLPFTSTSANPSQEPPARDAASVTNYFKNAIDLIIDGGESPGGKPSTIVDVTVTPLKVLREGSVRLTERDF
jgi:L-threonylcarbamoyladenylate synthase